MKKQSGVTTVQLNGKTLHVKKLTKEEMKKQQKIDKSLKKYSDTEIDRHTEEYGSYG
jgi:hypothetical protein